MSNNFFGQNYNFLENKISVNTHNPYQNTNKFSKTYYVPKEEKENSDLVLQKMQLSLNNFLSNLKKSQNIETTDPYPIEKESRTIENERSFNYVNSSFNQINNMFNKFQTPMTLQRSKEKSETNIFNQSNNDNSTRVFRSPYVQDKNIRGIPSFSNSMYSFYSLHNNNKLNNLNKYNNYNITGMQRSNTDNNHNFSLPQKLDNNKNSKILINENSSYSSEENRNISNTNTNNLNNNNSVKNKEPIHIVNNYDNDNDNNSNDFKKLVQRIKEKKLGQNKEKEMENDNLKKMNSINNFNISNEKKLQSLNNEVLLNSNKEKRNKKYIKDNILSFSKKYMDNNEEEHYSGRASLNRKKNNYLDSNIKKEYSREKDNDIKDNYRTDDKKKQGLTGPKESNASVNSKNDSMVNNNTNVNNIKKITLSSDRPKNEIDKKEEDKEESTQQKNNNNKNNYEYMNGINNNFEKKLPINNEYFNRINNGYEDKIHLNSEVKPDRRNKEKIQNFVINSPNVEIYDIYKSNLDKVDYNILPAMKFGAFTPDKDLKKVERNETNYIINNNNNNYNNNNYNNYNNNNLYNNNYNNYNNNYNNTNYNTNYNNYNNNYNKNITITKNNFEIINKNSNYKDEKDKILEKLLFENNALKETIIDKEKEIKQLNIDKTFYNGWDSSKYQQKIKELETKLKDNKSIKGQLSIIKSQKSNLYKDYNKYKEIADNLKKENEKLIKERDEYKKQRDKLNNEIKILKINSSHTGLNSSKNNIPKTVSRAKLLTENNRKIKIKVKKNTDKKLNILENESVAYTISKEPSFLGSNTNIIMNSNNNTNSNTNNNDNYYSRYRSENINYDNDDDFKIDIINSNMNKNSEMEKIISQKDKEILKYKEQIKALNKEIKDIKELKKSEKSKSRLKKANSVKFDENRDKSNNDEKTNNKKYIDEINELKNNIKKLENEKNSLKNRIDNKEKKKNNNEQLQKQNEDLKNKINHYNNQIKSLKSKNAEFEEFLATAKSFMKIIKPSNDKESNLYYKLKNHIDFLDKEKNAK